MVMDSNMQLIVTSQLGTTCMGEGGRAGAGFGKDAEAEDDT
jgi:hypothetical protein